MPIITHAVRAIFAYPFAMKVWDKLPRRISISTWLSRKKVLDSRTQTKPDLP